MSQSKIIRYKASAPTARYLGSSLRGIIDNVHSDVIRPILEKHNVREIVPDEWVSAQLQLDILREIEAQHTFEELVAIGVKAAEYAPLPPGVDTIAEILEVAPVMQQMVTQNVSPEEKVFIEKLGDNYYRMTLNMPVPPFVMYGYLYGLMRRVRGKGQSPAIYIIDDGTPYIFEFKW